MIRGDVKMELTEKIRKTIYKKIRKDTFEIIGYKWLEDKKKQIKESTYYNYKFILEKYLLQYFRDKSVKRTNDFSSFIDELSTSLAPKTVRDIFCVLKMILNYYEETCNKKLRYKRIILPKLEKKEIEILSSRDREKLENYCIKQNTLKSIGIVVCLNTGMRIGEICVLRWVNIDLTEKYIYIKETLQRVYRGKGERSKVIIGPPKTKCSIRTIPINSKIYNILKPISKKYKKHEFLLTGSTKSIEPRNYQDVFQKILTKAKVKKYNFHATRHTFATNCIEVRNGYKDAE